jgi:hypothetical protein
MDIKKYINNIYEFKFYKFYNDNNPNHYIIYDKKKSELYYNNKKICEFNMNDINKKILSKKNELFMILYNSTCHFLDIDIKYDIDNLKNYDDFLNEKINNNNNNELKEIIKKYIINKFNLTSNNEGLFINNFKYFNDCVSEEIVNKCIEDKIKIKKYIIEELTNFDKYLLDNMTNEEYNMLNKTKHNFKNLNDIHIFYNIKMNIINLYFNKLINDRCNNDKNDILINYIKNIYFYELCDYITEIYDIKNDIFDLYIKLYSYFNKVLMYN